MSHSAFHTYVEVIVWNISGHELSYSCTFTTIKIFWVVSNLTNNTYVDVIVLNLSWPAVSQICNLTFSPDKSTVLILKSTPIVVMYVPANKISTFFKIHDELFFLMDFYELTWLLEDIDMTDNLYTIKCVKSMSSMVNHESDLVRSNQKL